MAWVESSHKEGLVQELERDFIQNVIRFEKRTLAAVMTPRTDVFSLNVEMPWDEAVRRVRARHFSRIPVWEGREDDVIGLLHAKDLLRAGDGHGEGASLRGLLRPVTFAPETKRAEAMLWEMQKKRLHMVIVVDEYGGLAGLVTLDDLLEELFGEIYDEHELTARPIREKAPGVWTVSASLEVPEFNERLGERLGAPLPEEEGYETLGGFLLHAFGRMPTQGEELRYDGLRFVPTRLKGTRILEVEVRKP
jgi:CBS domain containing-hemolysin-like protein